MEVVEVRTGRAWRLWEGGREVGIILVARVRSSRPMYSAYSGRDGRWRWDLGSSAVWNETVSRIRVFDPSAPGVATRVLAEVIERTL